MIQFFEREETGLSRSITVFVVLFTATLAVSIFLNQIGYYGALVLLLVTWWRTKENPFTISSLEIGFALYIAAVLLAAVFSESKPEAFHKLLKRTLLIPTVYTLAAAASSEFKLKLYYKSIIWFTAIVALIYLGFAFQSYTTHELQRTGSGPAVFQHPITTSQMFTYALMLCAGIILGNKNFDKSRWIYIALGIILLLGLLATYKRTGWLGGIAGFAFMLFLARKWMVGAAFVTVLLIAVYLQPNDSFIYVFDSNTPGKIEKSIPTEGRVGTPIVIGDKLIITDFDKGLLSFNQRLQQVEQQVLGEPVCNLYRLNDTLFGAYYFNMSMQLLTFENGKAKKINEPLLSPGDTKHCTIVGERVYFLDNDSGLTVIRNTAKQPERFRFPAFNDYAYFSVDSSYIVFYEAGARTKLMQLDSLGLPFGEPVLLPFSAKQISLAAVTRNHFVRVLGNAVEIYQLNSRKLVLENRFETAGIMSIEALGDSLLLPTTAGLITYRFSNQRRTTFSFGDINFAQGCFFAKYNDKLIVTMVNRGRLLSIVDPYNQSNYNRMAFWRAAINIFKDYPVFGIGDIDVANHYIKYKRVTDKEVRGHFHNNFFHIMATLGGFGLLAFVILLGLIFRLNMRALRKVAASSEMYPFALGLFGMFAAFVFSGLTEWNFGDHETVTWLWLAAGFQAAVLRIVSKPEDHSSLH